MREGGSEREGGEGESDWRAADECHLPHLLGYGVHTHIATDRVVQRGQTHEQCSKEVAVGSGSHWIVLPATCREGDMHSRQQPVSASGSVEQCSAALTVGGHEYEPLLQQHVDSLH